MTVENQFPYQSYTANGSQTDFVLSFYVEDKNNFVVKKNGSVVSVNDYEYTSSNSIRFNIAPRSGDLIEVERNTKPERATTYTTYNNTFRPEVLNHDLDRVWRKIQELGVVDWILNNKIDSLKTYVDLQDSAVRQYVDAKNNELKSLLLDEISKQGIALDQLEDYYNYLMQKLAEIAVHGGWLDSYVATWSGRTQEQKNKDFIVAEDFGAKGDGIVDDTQAFTSLEDAYQNRIIDLKGQTYHVTETPTKNKYINGSFKVQDSALVADAYHSAKNQALSPVNLKSQLNDKASSLMWSWFLTSSWVVGADSNAAQNIVFDERNRFIYAMYESSTYGGSCVMYRIPMDCGLDFNNPTWAADADIRIGHQGLAIEQTDQATFIWSSKRNSTNNVDAQAGCKVIRFRVDNVPSYSSAAGATNEWSGRNGFYFENVEEYQLFPLQNTEQNTNVTISYDQKYLIAKMSAGANYRIRVWLLDTLTKGGSGDYSKKYLHEFLVPLTGNTGITMQDMCSDGNYLYLYGGRGNIADGASLSVQVYNLRGDYITGYTQSDLGLDDSTNYVRPNNTSASTVSETESINIVTINGKPQLTVHIASGTGGSRPNLVYAVGGAYGNYRGNSKHPALVLGHTQDIGGVDLAGQRRKSLKIGMVSDDGVQTQNIVVKASKVAMGNGEDYGGNLQLESIFPLGVPNTQAHGHFAVMRRNDGNSTGARLSLSRSRHTSQYGTKAVQSGDEVGSIWFVADDGSQDYNSSGGLGAGQIAVNVVGTPSVGSMSSTMIFSTRIATELAARWSISSTGDFAPYASNTYTLGLSNRIVKDLYIQNAPIVSSDERLKQQFRSPNEAEKLAATEIKNSICLYKFNDAVDIKGDGARWHVGVKAQQVVAIMQDHGLNPFDYGFICYDEWDAKPEIVEDGKVIQEAEEAGSRYAVRYDELAMFILSSI